MDNNLLTALEAAKMNNAKLFDNPEDAAPDVYFDEGIDASIVIVKQHMEAEPTKEMILAFLAAAADRHHVITANMFRECYKAMLATQETPNGTGCTFRDSGGYVIVESADIEVEDCTFTQGQSHE